MREPIGLAYLLARMTDTVADTSSQPAARRLALMDSLQSAMEAPVEGPRVQEALHEFARHVQNRQERALLAQGQACIDAFHQQPQTHQVVIRQVLHAITEGQRWDLSALDDPQRGVQTRQELERYTWLVAGSVGEFWTRICELHLKNWHNAQTADLMEWSAQYGQGLQRLNILRDAGQDLRAGRCYWPAEELHPLGLDRQRLCQAVHTGDQTTLALLNPLLTNWYQMTEEQLHAGLRYSLALHGWRLRLASALPCLIGIRTLGLLRQAGPRALLEHIKLPRRRVQKLLLGLILSGVSARQLRASWASAVHTSEPTGDSARIGP